MIYVVHSCNDRAMSSGPRITIDSNQVAVDVKPMWKVRQIPKLSDARYLQGARSCYKSEFSKSDDF